MQTKNIIGLFLVIAVFISIAFCCCRKPDDLVSKTDNKTTINGNSNQSKTSSPSPNISTNSTPSGGTATTPTPTVYPAGLSSAENLEKGKKALSDGDQRKAWKHLFQIKKGAKEFASANQLLASIGERKQIEFELEELNEKEENLKRIASGLAYRVEPDKLIKMLDNIEKQQRAIYARRQELNRKLKSMQ